MGFSLAIVFVTVAIVSASCLEIENNDPLCPPPEQIHPCTCSVITGLVTALCKDIKNQNEIRDVFAKNPGWKLQVVQFEKCTLNYIPSSIVKTASFQVLQVTNSTLVTIFDAIPVKTPKINVHLTDVKILRNVQWEFFSTANLFTLKIANTVIPTIGSTFKKHMPDVVKYLWLQNTKTAKIGDQAFQRLVNVDTLGLVGGSIKKVSRDMFPRPWNITYFKLAFQKLSAFPKDFFVDLPNIGVFDAEGNHFTTLNEEVFTKRGMSYIFNYNPIVCNCQVKWLTVFSEASYTRFYGKCFEPQSFKGRELPTLTKDDFRYCQ